MFSGFFITLLMGKTNFYLGLDSGGTNCRISACNENLEVISTVIYTSVHFSEAGAIDFARHISENLKLFIEQFRLDFSDCKGMCAGVAGARTASNKNDIKVYLCQFLGFDNIVIESDTAIAFVDAHGEDDGLILICGTGSALFGRVNGKIVRLGGWGKLLGDDGSSYFLSLNFLKQLVKYFDRYDERAEIEILLDKKFQINRENIIERIYHQKFDIASLSPFIVEQADKGDALCILVTENEIENILELFQSFIEKHNIKRNFSVAFTGSLIENDNYFSKTLRDLIRLNFGKEIFIKENLINPVNGALKTAIKYFKK